MKKITVLLILLLVIQANSFSQKKSGTIFSEHEAIEKTRALWKAVVDGDEAKYRSFFADSAYVSRNGEMRPKMANDQIGKGIGNMSSNYENFMIGDQEPAYPDAMEYKDGGVWVQDWLLISGIHKKTGIVLDLPVHNIYRMNDAGKITMMVNYFDDDVFEEINNSQTTKENGKVYINHPYIVTVRMLINAFAAGDLDAWESFFTPEARFTSSAMQPGESRSLEEHKQSLARMYLQDGLKYKVEQVGYPDCIYYEKSNGYIVYSWWNITVMKEGKKHVIPYMLAHNFNDDGKIAFTQIYFSSNHLENL